MHTVLSKEGFAKEDAWVAASEPKPETSKKMSDPVIHAFHKLGMFLVKSGMVRVPIGRLGS